MRRLLFSFLLSALFLAGCGSDDANLRHQAQVDELLQQLSVREKVAQLIVLEISRDPEEETRICQDSLVRDWGIGNLIIMRGPIGPFVERMNELQSLARLPLLVATDAEWGAAMRFAEYLPYPRQRILGRLEGRRARKLIYQMGSNVGRELRDLNIFVNYAPVVDVCPDPYDKSDGQRSFSGDPSVVADYASAYMRGMQNEGIYACAKHYPGHGATTVDSHFEMPVVLDDRARLDSVGLVPFQRLIDDGVAMVMVAHMSIPAIDTTGVPMSISAPCMKGLLREEQSFHGTVITDAVGMQGVAAGRSPLEVNLAVYRAGADMILMPDDIPATIEAIADSVSTGVWPQEELDAKVRKVLLMKAAAGFFDEGFDPQVRDLDQKIAAARHRDSLLQSRIARALRRSSQPEIVPLDGDRTLLLDKGEAK